MKTDKISMADCAYNYLLKRKKAKSFYDIWNNVVAELEISNEENDEIISFFYTNLTLDGRFVNVGENKWDLRERLPFEKVHIDMNDIYSEDEEGYEEGYENEEDDDGLITSEEDFDSYEEKEALEAAKLGFNISSEDDE